MLLLVFLIVVAQSCTALLNVSLDSTSCAGMRREVTRHTSHVTRHTSRVTHHLLLNEIRLTLQRLAVAVDAVQLGLPRVSAAQRTQKSGYYERSGKQRAQHLQHGALLVDGRQLRRVAVHLRLHRAAPSLQPWQRGLERGFRWG
jgi:hypothetical protein